MGLPFTIVTGAVFISDQDGEIAEVVTRSNSSKALATQSELVGSDVYNVLRNVQTVQRTDGLYGLATQSLVTVESTFGYDQNPDTWFRIVNTGLEGDTLTINIAGTNFDPSVPDRDAPPYTKMFTILASEVGDEIKLRDRIVQGLNSDPLFNKNGINFKAQNATDRAIVHLTSNRFSLSGEGWERPNLGDFQVVTTGACNVFVGYDNVISRSKPVSISRDFDSPHRLGLFGITGQVQVTAKDLEDLYINNATLNGDGITKSMAVNASLANPAVFLINSLVDSTLFIEELRFFGAGNGIKFGNFLSLNAALTNGILVEIKSNDTITILPLIKTTDDFKNRFAFGNSTTGFDLYVASGRDDFTAVFSFNNPFLLQPAGTFAIDDYIRVSVRDNTGSVTQLEFMAKGFEKAP